MEGAVFSFFQACIIFLVHNLPIHQGEGHAFAMRCVYKVGETPGGGKHQVGRLPGGDSVAEGGKGEYLGSGHHSGVAAPAFLQQGRRLHHLHHVEVVAAGTSVGTQGDTGAGIEEFEHGETIAAAKFEVAVGTMYTGDVMVSDKVYLMV